MSTRVAIAGLAVSPGRDLNLKADEIAFDVVARALRQSGFRGQDVDQAMLSSMDLYDGRAISNGLVIPAVGGYLKDENRVEGDASLAIIGAASSILGRQSDVSVVVALHTPEIAQERTESVDELRRFADEISRFAFDGHHARPLGVTASAVLGLQAQYALGSGRVGRAGLCARAAKDITRGADGAWSDRRSAVDAQTVQSSALVSDPLTSLMMPGECCGVVAMVLASENRAVRARGARAWISGWGVANTPYLSSSSWLSDPAAGARTASERAARTAGIGAANEVDVIEHTSLTPALEPYVEEALGIEAGDDRVNRHGGAMSSFPGLANGAFRLARAVETLESTGGQHALVHSTENLLGTVSAATSAIILEKA